MYLIKEASQIVGVTIRTLHYYDQIGLIKVKKGKNGYRYYENEDIEKIQIIKYYRFLGLSLKNIKDIMGEDDFDIIASLENQLILLSKEQSKIDIMMKSIKQTILSKKEKKLAQYSDGFQGFTILDNIRYHGEAIDKFGKEVMIESARRQRGSELEINDHFNKIFQKFKLLMIQKVQLGSDELWQVCQELYDTLNKYAFDCSIEVYAEIGKSYYGNLEFRENIDRFKNGLAEYISLAIINFSNEGIRYSKLLDSTKTKPL